MGAWGKGEKALFKGFFPLPPAAGGIHSIALPRGAHCHFRPYAIPERDASLFRRTATKEATAMKNASHLATGASGEEAALRHLSRQGFSPTARNWRPRGGAGRTELDLVGKWDKTLVFVEVKTRRIAAASPLDAPAGLRNFSPAKRRNMVRAARAYLTEHGLWNMPCRFDLVCVTFLPGAQPQVDHYRDVIELGQTLDRGYAPWQPW